MIRKLKYIATIFLLMMFLISSIGFSVSIHKCKTDGSTHLSFFNSSKNTECSSCSCPSNEEKSSGNETESSCCGTEENNDKQIIDSESVDNEENCSNSCCSIANSTDDNKVLTEGTKSEQSQAEESDFGFGSINSQCCSNTNISYAFTFEYSALESSDKIFDLPVSASNSYQKLTLDPTNIDKLSFKDIQFPLKEPICCIISFIHFTSASGDDSVPDFFLC